MNLNSNLLLEFAPSLNKLGDKMLTDGLSAVLQIRDTLWVANDECLSLERLTLEQANSVGNLMASQHKRFELQEFIKLPDPDDGSEADLEGLAYADGYLWLVGSHSLKRKNPKPKKDDKTKVFEKLATLEGDGNRYLLARIPVEENGKSADLAKQVGERQAAVLKGNQFGNELTEALSKDEHLAAFIPQPPKEKKDKWQGIPGKDNGFDIEGLAVVGKRLFIGLRGPVLRGWAVILEIEPEVEVDGDGHFKLRKIGPGEAVYRKHFLQLGGLGIRDLCSLEEGLLILAGPTMDLDGPVRLFLWKGVAELKGESSVSAKELAVVGEIPFGQGADHAEGIALLSVEAQPPQLVVVHDVPSKIRRPRENELMADVYSLQP